MAMVLLKMDKKCKFFNEKRKILKNNIVGKIVGTAILAGAIVLPFVPVSIMAEKTTDDLHKFKSTDTYYNSYNDELALLQSLNLNQESYEQKIADLNSYKHTVEIANTSGNTYYAKLLKKDNTLCVISFIGAGGFYVLYAVGLICCEKIRNNKETTKTASEEELMIK